MDSISGPLAIALPLSESGMPLTLGIASLYGPVCVSGKYTFCSNIDIKFLVVKERVQNGQIMIEVIEHIGTNSMLADPLTKALVPKFFHEHTKNMGIVLDDTTV